MCIFYYIKLVDILLNEQGGTGYKIDKGIEWKCSISKNGVRTALRFYGGIPPACGLPVTQIRYYSFLRESVTSTRLSCANRYIDFRLILQIVPSKFLYYIL